MLKSSSNLAAAKWPLKQMLASIDAYKQSAKLRNVGPELENSLSELASISNQTAALAAQRQAAATARNAFTKQIKMGNPKNNQMNEEYKAQSKLLKENFKRADLAHEKLLHAQSQILEAIPNLIAPNTSILGAKEFEVIGYLNKAQPAASRHNHTDIGQKLGILDLKSGARVSGTGHYYLIGKGALLEQALVQYALEKCTEFGFTQVSVPHLIRNEFSAACGFRPRDQNNEVQTYSVQGGSNQRDLCLAGTAEIPLASWKAHSTVATPFKACAVSRSFRAEAGARGADTKGLYRVHEFTKVEMFMWADPDIEASSRALEELLAYQKDIIGSLGLNTRVLRIGPTDLGAPAYEKYDLESWMPGRNQWGEVSSVSNCTDYQSRRLWTTNEEGQFVHTLNGTAMAVPRIIVAILENNYDENLNQVRVPAVLRKWLPEFI